MPYLLFAQNNKLNYIELEQDFMLTLGCTSDCNVILPQDSASHFRVYFDTEKRWLLENFGYSPEDSSRFVPLGNGDRIELGSMAISFLESIEGLNAAPFEGIISFCAGQKIGDYTILNLLTRTDRGALYLANSSSGEAYALRTFDKVLSKAEADEFYAQIHQTDGLSPCGLTPYYAYGIFRRNAYYVTDYCPHPNLEFRISAKAPMEETEAVRIICHIVEILRHAQCETGLFHGGLEPSKILYDSNERVRVAEFGLFLWKSLVLNGGCAAISPWYISPEEISGDEISFRSDMYTLGVILFQMLTGVLPFHSENKEELYSMHLKEAFPLPMERNPNIRLSSGTLQLLLKMTERDPSNRFRSWDELLETAAHAGSETSSAFSADDDSDSFDPESSTMKLRSLLT